MGTLLQFSASVKIIKAQVSCMDKDMYGVC